LYLKAQEKKIVYLHFANIRLYPNKTGIVPEG
jgi:hypothetical protein